jgi:hypothetical protein
VTARELSAEELAAEFEQIAAAKSEFWDALRQANKANEGRAVPDTAEIERLYVVMDELDKRVERLHESNFPDVGTLAVLADGAIGQAAHAFTCDPDGENYREVWTARDGLAVEAVSPFQVGDRVRYVRAVVTGAGALVGAEGTVTAVADNPAPDDFGLVLVSVDLGDGKTPAAFRPEELERVESESTTDRRFQVGDTVRGRVSGDPGVVVKHPAGDAENVPVQFRGGLSVHFVFPEDLEFISASEVPADGVTHRYATGHEVRFGDIIRKGTSSEWQVTGLNWAPRDLATRHVPSVILLSATGKRPQRGHALVADVTLVRRADGSGPEATRADDVEPERPTVAGQEVWNARGMRGVTTEVPIKGRIAVQWIGTAGTYPVVEDVNDLTLSAPADDVAGSAAVAEDDAEDQAVTR